MRKKKTLLSKYRKARGENCRLRSFIQNPIGQLGVKISSQEELHLDFVPNKQLLCIPLNNIKDVMVGTSLYSVSIRNSGEHPIYLIPEAN